MEKLPEFRAKNRHDLLAEFVDTLLRSSDENAFFFLMGQKLRGQKGKAYKNIDKKLPLEGDYQELEVTDSSDSRRLIVDTVNNDIYATRDHYKTISYAGRPIWAE